jgi:hypothetical protein
LVEVVDWSKDARYDIDLILIRYAIVKVDAKINEIK